MTRPTVADIPRLWYRLRILVHRLMYRCEWLPFEGDHVVAVCDCGGHARIRRNADATSTIFDVSCPLWTWAGKARRLPLPIARLLP